MHAATVAVTRHQLREHARQLGYRNALIYSMDSELHSHLSARSVPSFDGSALLNAWNNTCLQRHIQAVRMERHVAVAALLSAGLDVLQTDATCLFLRDDGVGQRR